MNDSREGGKADSREAAKHAKKSDAEEELRVFAPSRETGTASPREAAKDAKKSVGEENLRVFVPSREIGTAGSRDGGKADSRGAAKGAQKSVDGENLRAFVPSREIGTAGSRDGGKADSRGAAKGAQKSVEEENLRVFASSREVDVIAEPQPLNVEQLSAVVVDCAYKLHVEVGPGLLESVYEAVLARMIQQRGVPVRRQVAIPFQLMDMKFDEGFRLDLLVDGRLVVELKSVERLMPVHAKQLLTYLRLLNLPLGLLVNFGASTFKEGIRRIVNQHHDFASSRLRVNQESVTGEQS